MPNSILPIPKDVLQKMLRSESREKGFSDPAVRISLLLDVDAGNIRSQRDYATLWGWSRKKVRYHWDEIEGDVLGWLGPDRGPLRAQQGPGLGPNNRAMEDSKTDSGPSKGPGWGPKGAHSAENEAPRAREETPSLDVLEQDNSISSKEKGTPKGVPKKKGFSPDDVERIYQLYPRKVGKRAAIKAIPKALARIEGSEERARGDPVGWLAAKVKLFADSPKGQSGQYCPYPATWFNEDRFFDDEQEWQRNGATETHRRPDQRNGTFQDAGEDEAGPSQDLPRGISERIRRRLERKRDGELTDFEYAIACGYSVEEVGGLASARDIDRYGLPTDLEGDASGLPARLDAVRPDHGAQDREGQAEEVGGSASSE